MVHEPAIGRYEPSVSKKIPQSVHIPYFNIHMRININKG